MKERPILFSGPMVRAILDGRKTQTRRVVKPRQGMLDDWTGLPCPYGKPGDRLWVRETCYFEQPHGEVIYRADPGSEKALDPEFTGLRWRPSIHMPRWASRITLEIVNVRVERLQDIRVDDARAEGVTAKWPVHGFRNLWQSINGFGSWDANPWVWVVEFRNMERSGG